MTKMELLKSDVITVDPSVIQVFLMKNGKSNNAESWDAWNAWDAWDAWNAWDAD